MGLINKLSRRDHNMQCSLGIHRGSWIYIDDDSCRQDLRCCAPGCGAIETRTVHAWDDGTHEPSDQSPCRTRYTCSRDGATSHADLHPVWEWRYVIDLTQTDDDPTDVWCENRMYCTRCNQQHPTSPILVEHEWGPETLNPETGAPEQVCVRDGSVRQRNQVLNSTT